MRRIASRSTALLVVIVFGTACASYKGRTMSAPTAGAMPGWRVDGDVGVGADVYAAGQRQKAAFDADLSKDAILAVHVLVENQGARRLTVRPSEMILTLADNRQIASTPSSLVAAKVGEDDNVIGFALGFGLIGYLAASSAEERARADRVRDYRDKEFPEVTLTPRRSAHGVVFFVPPPATPAFDTATLTIKAIDADDASSRSIGVPLTGLGFLGGKRDEIASATSPARGTSAALMAPPSPNAPPIVGIWSGSLVPPRTGAVPPVTGRPTTLKIYEDGDTLRWAMEVENDVGSGAGTVEQTDDGIVLRGKTVGRTPMTIVYKVTMTGRTLEGSGLGADNRVYLLSLRKR